jgi:hypothetical protein
MDSDLLVSRILSQSWVETGQTITKAKELFAYSTDHPLFLEVSNNLGWQDWDISEIIKAEVDDGNQYLSIRLEDPDNPLTQGYQADFNGWWFMGNTQTNWRRVRSKDHYKFHAKPEGTDAPQLVLELEDSGILDRIGDLFDDDDPEDITTDPDTTMTEEDEPWYVIGTEFLFIPVLVGLGVITILRKKRREN